MNAPIDFQAIAERVNLGAMLEAQFGPPNSSRKWACPFHTDHRPSLSLTPDGRRYKCWSAECRASGTALDWIMWRDGVSLVEAARRLGPGHHDPVRPTPPKPRPKPPKPSAWQDQGWQDAVDAIISRAEADLWSDVGKDARRWLRWRKIDDATARRFRLGFVPADVWSDRLAALAGDDGRHHAIRVRRGITFPWVAPGGVYLASEPTENPRWVGCQVRQLAADVFADLPEDEPKNIALKGSSRGYCYPWPDLLPSQEGPPALIVEGEFDALIGTQELGDLVHVVTVGGATQRPQDSAVAFLDRCPWWLLGLDHDPSGVAAASEWRARCPEKCRRVILPAKDLGEFVMAGGNSREWLAGEFARLGIDPQGDL